MLQHVARTMVAKAQTQTIVSSVSWTLGVSGLCTKASSATTAVVSVTAWSALGCIETVRDARVPNYLLAVALRCAVFKSGRRVAALLL